MRRIALILAAVLAAASAVMGGTLPARAEVDPYITEGTHTVNGRQWRTTCEKYSQTTRCRAEIWATQIRHVNGKFVSRNGWAFNNLTYLPSSRQLWTENPLGFTNRWTAMDGRRWYTECDTPATGRNGCRSYAEATVIEITKKGGVSTYRWVNKFIFNNIVLFTVRKLPDVPVVMPDENLKECINLKLDKPRDADIMLQEAAGIDEVLCEGKAIADLTGLEHFLNLEKLDLWNNEVSDLTPLSGLESLDWLFLSTNEISDVTPLGSVTSLTFLDLGSNNVTSISPLNSLKSLVYLGLSKNKVQDLTPLRSMKSLTNLDVSDNLVASLDGVEGLTALQGLIARKNGISDISALASLSNMETLYLTQNQISDITPMSGMKKLRIFEAPWNKIANLSALSTLTDLDYLFLWGNKIKDVTPVQSLTNLTRMNLSRNEIVDVTPIASLVSLEFLALYSNKIVRVAPLAALPMGSGDTLNLWDNPIVDKESLQPLKDRGVDVRFEN